MGDFTPGVERARRAGYTIEVHPYVGTGDEQVQESLAVIAKKIRDGRLDPDIRGWVGDVLKAAGNPKTRAAKVQAILDAFRQSTIYVSDPVGAEYIVAAGTTMCLRPGLCVRARDCIPEGTKLLRDDGPISIEHVRPGDRIWGKDTWTTVQAVWSKGVLPVDEILLATGACVRLTGDHKVYVWRDRGATHGYESMRVSELEEEDILLRPERLPTAEGTRDNGVDVRSIARSVANLPCWDLTTEDHYVYLPEHDVTVSNCDDGVVAVGSACLAAGIPGEVVKQNFGPGKQEHVLWEAILEDGSRFPADPSTNLPAGDKVPAVQEERLDPMDVEGSHGTSGPEIVTLGSLPDDSDLPPRDPVTKVDGVWTVKRYGQWWTHETGVGWIPVGTGDACCAACAEKEAAAKAAGAGAGDHGDPPYPAPAGKQWVWGRGCTEPGGGIVPGWGLIDAPASGAGRVKEGDDPGCSACEAWARKHEEEIQNLTKGASGASGVSSAPSSKIVKSSPRLSLLGRLRDGRMGLGADVPGTTPLVVTTPTTIRPTSGSVGVGGVALVALGVAALGGIGWGIAKASCTPTPTRRRRAA